MSLFKGTVDKIDYVTEGVVHLLNGNRLLNPRTVETDKILTKYPNNPDDRRDRAKKFQIDNTITEAKGFMNTAFENEFIELDVHLGKDRTAATEAITYFCKDIVDGTANASDATKTDLLIADGGGFGSGTENVSKEVVDHSIDEIISLANDGALFLTFNMLAADNAALSVDVTGVVDVAAKTIALDVPNGTVVTALVASFTLDGDYTTVKVSTTEQVSGTTANDFTAAVDYLIKDAADATLATYEVTVTVLP
jgi:hypothetical protein